MNSLGAELSARTLPRKCHHFFTAFFRSHPLDWELFLGSFAPLRRYKLVGSQHLFLSYTMIALSEGICPTNSRDTLAAKTIKIHTHCQSH